MGKKKKTKTEQIRLAADVLRDAAMVMGLHGFKTVPKFLNAFLRPLLRKELAKLAKEAQKRADEPPEEEDKTDN